MTERKSIINDGMSIASVQHCLEMRGVERVDLHLGGANTDFLAQAYLHALRGPEGHVTSKLHAGVTLGEALDKVCQELDEAAEREICVFDAAGTLRGRFPSTDEGRKYAGKMISTTCRSGSSNFPK